MPAKKEIDILKEQVAELALECEKVPELALECKRIDDELNNLKKDVRLIGSKRPSLGYIRSRFKGG